MPLLVYVHMLYVIFFSRLQFTVETKLMAL